MRAAYAIVLCLAGCAASGPPRRWDAPFAARGAPLLIVHGVLVGNKVVPGQTTFDPAIVRALTEAGFDARLPALPAVAPSTERAPFLARAIDEILRDHPGDKVLVIAHSQAGVDVRLLLADPAQRDKIGAVATLSTPHEGTVLAEIGEKLYGSLVETIMNRAARRIAESRGWSGREGHARALIASLTPREMRRLSSLPRGEVPFFSVAATPEPARDGSCDGGWWPAPTAHNARHFALGVGGAIIADNLPGRAQDGLVPTASERFAEFLGCAPIDHMGWLSAHPDGFDNVAFLVELARGLEDSAQAGTIEPMRARSGMLGKIVVGK
jgi:triacylglycerol esterase/lipase EstA (alpha/beta hydrolase family)